MTFEAITRVTSGTWNVPEKWRQGRGAFGGLTLATLARASSEHEGAKDRALRSLTAEIPGAVLAGPAAVRVAPLRVGSGLSTLAASVEQNGETIAHAVCSFGKTRVTDFDRCDVPPPSAPPFTSIEPVPVTFPGPEFAHNFEFRLIRGVPMGGENDAVTEGWVRIREPGAISRTVALVALLDAWFPSVYPIISAPRPFGTISFAAHFFEREWSLEEPLHHRSRLIASQQGYFVEVRELFTPRGELCAINQQTMAVIK